jgi:hypothetical protein
LGLVAKNREHEGAVVLVVLGFPVQQAPTSWVRTSIDQLCRTSAVIVGVLAEAWRRGPTVAVVSDGGGSMEERPWYM